MVAKDKRQEKIRDIIKLRSIVGYLGEKNQGAWWDTEFLNRTGLQFLEINFPRTAFAAGCNAVIEAAKNLHDERIGKGGVYHLFRLPSGIEEALHRSLLSADPGMYLPHLESWESAMDALRGRVSETLDAPEGPVQIGTLKAMLQDSDIQKLAAYYFDAFQNEKICFPYFSAGE